MSAVPKQSFERVLNPRIRESGTRPKVGIDNLINFFIFINFWLELYFKKFGRDVTKLQNITDHKKYF